MTVLDGRIIKCTNVLWSDLEKLQREAGKKIPDLQIATNLVEAVALILASAEGEAGWKGLTKAQLETIDSLLKGQVTSVVGTLAEWAFSRSEDAPSVVEYLTGERMRGRTPQDMVKRPLKLDPRVAERIRNSPYLPRNETLREIVKGVCEEWEERKKGSKQKRESDR